MKHPLKLYITVILLWFVARGSMCGGPRLENCGDYISDTTLLSARITNPAPVNHVLDTVNIFSRISDTLHALSGTTLITDINMLGINLQAYKVIPAGSAFVLNYANIEFNYLITKGIIQNSGGSGNAILYERTQPYNTIDISLVAGYTGLYLIKVEANSGYSGSGYAQFYDANNYCHSFFGEIEIPVTNQNRQYWDSLGITTLTLANSVAYSINKPDKNYFFVNILP
ncbi:MAG: hypothetical protein ABIT58_04095 [Ferruginibacter sp.]